MSVQTWNFELTLTHRHGNPLNNFKGHQLVKNTSVNLPGRDIHGKVYGGSEIVLYPGEYHYFWGTGDASDLEGWKTTAGTVVGILVTGDTQAEVMAYA
jgi:hypothetical protein